MESTRILSAECPVCHDKYDNKRRPLLIPDCGHSVCKDCFEAMKQTALMNFTSLRCPTCQRGIGKTELAVNWQLMNLVEETSKLQEKTIDQRFELEVLKRERERAEEKAERAEKKRLDIERKSGSKPQRSVRPETVFVKNLPKTASKEDVEKFFSPHARIATTQGGELKVILYNDKQTGNPLGRCMVTFVDAVSARKIIKMFNKVKFPGSENVLELEHGSFEVKETERVQVKTDNRNDDALFRGYYERGRGRGGLERGGANWNQSNRRGGASGANPFISNQQNARGAGLHNGFNRGGPRGRGTASRGDYRGQSRGATPRQTAPPTDEGGCVIC